MKKENIGIVLLVVLGLIAIITMFSIPPISQDEQYHNFSDTRTFLNIPNFWNVISNLVFVAVAVFGLRNVKSIRKMKLQYKTLFYGIILVALGSGYYHLFPDEESLVWDRLPMVIVFMTLFSIVIGEFIKEELGTSLFIPLILIGILSVCYWCFSESGDLRIYALVQFYPMIAIPIILLFFKSKGVRSYGYWMLLMFYVIAKLFEHFDEEIYELLKVISGHSLKHIIAGLGLLYLLIHCKKNIPSADCSISYRSKVL